MPKTKKSESVIPSPARKPLERNCKLVQNHELLGTIKAIIEELPEDFITFQGKKYDILDVEYSGPMNGWIIHVDIIH